MNIFKGISEIAESVRGILDDNITTKQEKAEAIMAQFEAEIKDRDSARDMYKDDSSLQKWFALVFLACYMLLTLAMLYFIYLLAFEGAVAKIELPDWATNFLIMIFTAMSTKVATICDFLFGGSKKNFEDAFEKRKK